MALVNKDSFEWPKDPEVKMTAVIVLAALAYLVIASRVFRDVNAS